MITSLFPQFAATLSALHDREVADPRGVEALRLDRIDVTGKTVEMVYAPFDHVNGNARLVIVGMTPGLRQASNALVAARNALRSGRTHAQAGEEAKVFASFSGEPMRGNLVRMLDLIGVAKALGIASTDQLWNGAARLVHFTSALRYPVFVDGENWSGNPDMLRVPQMRSWLEDYTGAELASLPDAILVPLGPKVATALGHLAGAGLISADRILGGLPHPSGANAERVACFMGTKPAHLASAKTNAAALCTAREALVARVSQLG